MKTISETYKEKEDEKGSGGFWDLAGEIAEQYALECKEKDNDEPVWADEKLQEIIYNKIKPRITSTLTAILQGDVERLEGMKRIRGEEKPYMWLTDEAEKFDGIPSNMDNKKIIGYNTALQDHITYLNEQIKLLSK